MRMRVNVLFHMFLISYLFGVVQSVQHAIFSQFPNMSLFKHSPKAIAAFIDKSKDRAVNHAFPGYSQSSEDDPVPPSPYRRNFRKVILGKGSKVFKRATDALLSFEMTNAMSWAEIHVEADNTPRVGKVLCTLVKCYGLLWSLNPCKITHIRINERVACEKRGEITLSEVIYSAMKGHLIGGEERFRVTMGQPSRAGADDGEVAFVMYSFTQGGNALGKLAMPLIRPLQRQFFVDNGKAMKSLMGESSKSAEA